MNVEVCSSIVAVKYAFKYVYKGHDKQAIHLSSDDVKPVNNEIKRYQDGRYISLAEAMWRIYGFPLANMNPVVVPLQVHLPDQQQVRFADDVDLTRIIESERDKRSMLNAFFERNETDVDARQYLYKDFPKYYVWNSASRVWTLRKKNPARGRLVSAHPTEGERFYLPALVRGLIENDESLSLCLSEATLFSFPPALRRLFATILTFCSPGDVRKLWDDHYEALSEDYCYRIRNAAQVRNNVLHDIRGFLRSLGKDLSDFDLLELNTEVDSDSFNVREVEDEYAIVVYEEHLRARHCLTYDEIIRYVNKNDSGVFFIDGPGGTGKTHMYNALLAEVCSRGSVALATASSGAAANNMPGGRTVHSRFKIPLNVDKKSFCTSMAKRHAIEDVDRTMQDIMGDSRAFGGKVMVMGADFRQVLPVVRRGTRAQVVDASLRMSPLWSTVKKMQLSINMRARTDPWFLDFLLRVGDGVEETVEDTCVRQITRDCKKMLQRKIEEFEAFNSSLPVNKYMNYNCFYCNQNGHIMKTCPTKIKNDAAHTQNISGGIMEGNKINPTQFEFTSDKSKILCFKCRQYGHFANKCPPEKQDHPKVSLKYPEFIHFQTKGIIKGTDKDRVHFAPEITINILSINLLKQQGLDIIFEGDKCTIEYMFKNQQGQNMDGRTQDESKTRHNDWSG
ncbi:uncharacterized protein Tco_0963325 [Tanacetum coccineum]